MPEWNPGRAGNRQRFKIIQRNKYPVSYTHLSVAHDSHNIIAAGDNDEDIIKAVQTIEEIQGGYALVSEGKVLGTLPLTVAGLLSQKPAKDIQKEMCIRDRLKYYADHFWLMFDGDKLIAFVDGFVTDEEDLTDEMYAKAQLHNESGAWQMIFGVDVYKRQVLQRSQERW